MKNLLLNDAQHAALLQAVEMNIDMLNDMGMDSVWMNVSQVRELATKSDEEIRATMTSNTEEAWKEIEKLQNLQLIYNELKD